MRGLFTSGVTDVLMENGIEFDTAIAVSAGACFGCNYKSKQIGRVVRYATKYCNYWKFCSIRSWLVTGDVFGGKFCYDDIPKELDKFDYETYRSNSMDFIVVAVDINTGEAVYHNLKTCDDEDIKWMRASASQPVLSRPVKIGDSLYLDGGMRDSIPLKYMTDHGYDRNIVILTQPEGYVKKQMKIMPLVRLLTLRHPKIAEALESRPAIYNEQTAYVKKCEQEGTALVICPDAPLGLKTMVHDPNELRRVYDLGRQAAEKRMGEIKAFMAG